MVKPQTLPRSVTSSLVLSWVTLSSRMAHFTSFYYLKQSEQSINLLQGTVTPLVLQVTFLGNTWGVTVGCSDLSWLSTRKLHSVSCLVMFVSMCVTRYRQPWQAVNLQLLQTAQTACQSIATTDSPDSLSIYSYYRQPWQHVNLQLLQTALTACQSTATTDSPDSLSIYSYYRQPRQPVNLQLLQTTLTACQSTATTDSPATTDNPDSMSIYSYYRQPRQHVNLQLL